MKKYARISIIQMVILIIFSGSIFASGERLVVQYDFSKPQIGKRTIPLDSGKNLLVFDIVEMEDCYSLGEPGEPVLPLKAGHILLPQGYYLHNITAIPGKKKLIAKGVNILPGQIQVPLSQPEKWKFTEPNPRIYNSKQAFPKQIISNVSNQYCKGYHIIVFALSPVQYIPASGDLYYFESISVLLELEKGAPYKEEVVRCRATSRDREWVKRKVDNPELVDSYKSEPPNQVSYFETKDEYPLVIITNNSFASDTGANSLQALAQHKNQRGVKTLIKKVEDIYAVYPGADTQTKIRNFIIDAYNNLNTEFVILAGDSDHGNSGGESGDVIVPDRGFYATTSYGESDADIPADMYYANLDGTFNNDGDNLWAEPNDGIGFGEVDLYSEVAVGRFCADKLSEIRNIVSKVIWYESADPADPYLKRAYMLGELLWEDPLTYGDDYKEEIRLGSSNWGYTTRGFPLNEWTVSTLYDRRGEWSATTLINIINQNNTHIYNHLGHAYVDYMMRLYNSDIDGLTNNKYFFAYSQGCYCGSFDNRDDYGGTQSSDCASEHLTLNPTGAFAIVSNSRYGWGEYASTNGSSQYYDRQFFDAIFGEEILQLGWTNQDSKEDNIPFLSYGANRWCFYELNLFGDPSLEIGGGIGKDGIITLDKNIYAPGKSMNITVMDRDLNVNPGMIDQVNITVFSDSGDSETVFCYETGFSTSTFKGSISISAGDPVASNGILEGRHNDKLTADYLDADDGRGGYNVHKLAYAYLDALPPQITSLNIEKISHNSVTIFWQTDELSNSIVRYGTETSLGQQARSSFLTTAHRILVPGLEPCTKYYFEVASIDVAGNEGVDNNNGQLYNFWSWMQNIVMEEKMDANPQWNIQGGSGFFRWEFGQPAGSGGDPSSGYTGNFVYGYNLQGKYANNMTEQKLTTKAIDCTGMTDLKVSFYRWLCVENSNADHAYFRISTNGFSWTTLWENVFTITDSSWVYQEFDISAIADNKPQVYLQWGMGPTNDSITYCGWNIDDVRIFYAIPCNVPWLTFEECGVIDKNGNSNSEPDAGEEVELWVSLFNKGISVDNLRGKISTLSPYITIINDTAIFEHIPNNGSGKTKEPYFKIRIDRNIPNGEIVEFKLDWEWGEEKGIVNFSLKIFAPSMIIASLVIDDTLKGNANGILEPGETARIIATLNNEGSDAKSLKGRICICDEYIEIIDELADFTPSRRGGQSVSLSPHFSIRASESASNGHICAIEIDFISDLGKGITQPSFLGLGNMGKVLLVHDGGNSSYEMKNLLENLRFNVSVQEAKREIGKEDYDLVIWSCGNNSNPMDTQAERNQLMNYVDSGVKMIIEGGEAASAHTSHFLFSKKVLHTASVSGSPQGKLKFIDSSHLISCLPVRLPEEIGFNYTTPSDSDGVVPTSDAQKVMNWTDSQDASLLIYDDDQDMFNGGLVAFLSCNYSAIEARYRNAILINIISWISGKGGHPITPTPTPTFTPTPTTTPTPRPGTATPTATPSRTNTPPSPTPQGKSPVIMLAGYWTTDLKCDKGGILQMIALVNDKDGMMDIRRVEMCYQGLPIGLDLTDNGNSGDFGAGDGVYGFYENINGPIDKIQILLEIKALDWSSNQSFFWPYLTVKQ